MYAEYTLKSRIVAPAPISENVIFLTFPDRKNGPKDIWAPAPLSEGRHYARLKGMIFKSIKVYGVLWKCFIMLFQEAMASGKKQYIYLFDLLLSS